MSHAGEGSGETAREDLGVDPALGPPSARSGGSAAPSESAVTEWSAGGIVVRSIEGEIHVLLIRDPYQNWGLPKGHVERDENLEETALREVREETGLAELRLGPEAGTIDWFFRLGSRLVHKFCAFYVMFSDEGVAVPEREEGITECVWLPADHAVERISYSNTRETVREAVRRLREEGGT